VSGRYVDNVDRIAFFLGGAGQSYGWFFRCNGDGVSDQGGLLRESGSSPTTTNSSRFANIWFSWTQAAIDGSVGGHRPARDDPFNFQSGRPRVVELESRATAAELVIAGSARRTASESNSRRALIPIPKRKRV